jgi:hypothetical protein
MALEDYFNDIIIESLVGNKTDLLGGRVEEWGEATTIKGVVNQKYSNISTNSGRSGEESEYIGLFEITDNSTTYLKKPNRINDNGYIYKIRGKPKNTLNRNHHYRVELQYVDHIESE